MGVTESDFESSLFTIESETDNPLISIIPLFTVDQISLGISVKFLERNRSPIVKWFKKMGYFIFMTFVSLSQFCRATVLGSLV